MDINILSLLEFIKAYSPLQLVGLGVTVKPDYELSGLPHTQDEESYVAVVVLTFEGGQEFELTPNYQLRHNKKVDVELASRLTLIASALKYRASISRKEQEVTDLKTALEKVVVELNTPNP